MAAGIAMPVKQTKNEIRDFLRSYRDSITGILRAKKSNSIRHIQGG